ncbi:MAG: glycoside hydrolase family 88 protein [Clostridia bacterium]|nr:glycoside hydrolase family 88 protein [Clostridia bacterium]
MLILNDNDKKWVDETWEKLNEKLSRAAISAREKIPYSAADGKYDDEGKEPIFRWTNGFWPGLMWLMYVGTKNEEYRKTAENAEKMLDDAFSYPEYLCHDVGFMWHISSGVNYRLFKGEKSKKRVYLATQMLAGRFNPAGRYIQAWETPGREGWTIIDCMMNLPLLYLAAEEFLQPRFKNIAMCHADWAMKEHVRADGSVRHIVCTNPETGEVTGYVKGQGYSETSSWSRGQGWALYGFVLSYLHSGKEEYLETAKKVAHYVIAESSLNGWLQKVDYKGPCELCDTTAGAVSACGLIELAKLADEEERGLYLSAALNILHALDDNYCDWSERESVLQHGVATYFPDERRKGEHIIYGDYYFTEAIYKLKGFEPLFW